MSETEEFKIGDVVRLKSGGPDMTVVSLNENSMTHKGQIKCQWFEKNRPQDSIFPSAALEKVDEDAGFSIGVL